MSDDSAIRIPIILEGNTRGGEAAIKALERLSRAYSQVSPQQVKLAEAAARVAAAEAKQAAATARLAEIQNRAAISAQKLATEQNRTAAAASNATAAMARAEAATLRTAVAQQKASQAVRRTADGLAVLPRSFAGFAGSGIQEFSKGIESGLLGVVGPAALAAGALAGVGVAVQGVAAAANEALALEQTTNGLRLAAGSAETYGAALDIARRNQILFGGTAQENQAALIGLANISRTSGVALGEIDTVVRQLKAADPAATFEDASVALREFLSGDALSLRERFELDRDAVNALAAAAVPAEEKIRMLGEMLAQSGYSADTAAQAVPKARQEINELGADAERVRLAVGGLVAELAGLAAGAANNGGFGEFATDVERGEAIISGAIQRIGEGVDPITALRESTLELVNGITNVSPAAEGAAKGTDGLTKAAAEAAEKAELLDAALKLISDNGGAARAGLILAASGADAVKVSAAEAAQQVGLLLSLMAGVSTGGRDVGAPTRRTGVMNNFGDRAGGAAAAAASVARFRSFAVAAGGGVPQGGRGGGGGSSAASAAEKAARDQERAAERAQDILEREADRAEELAQRQADAERDRTERLAEIAQDRADRLAEIEADSASKLADLAADAEAKRQDIARQASARIKDIKAREVADIAQIQQDAAEEQAAAARDLGNSVAAALAQSAVSNAFDNLDLAGAGADPELMAREVAQARRATDLQAAGQRAAGFGDATVGAAAFAAESAAIEERAQLDARYAERKAELEGNAPALAELERYYQEALVQQRAGVEQQIAEAEAAAELRRAETEQRIAEVQDAARREREAVQQEAREQRRAVEEEARQQAAAVAAEAQKQRDEVAAQSADQAQQVEDAYAKQQEAIKRWADDSERDLQRVIDKADEATRALLKLARADVGGGDTASAETPQRHSGGPVTMGEAYRVMPNETFVAPDTGYILPFLPPGGGGGAAASGPVSLSITVNAAPGMDERGLADLVAQRANELLGRMARGRGF